MAEINRQILASLNSFTESLRRENVRLDEEERKNRVRESASRISEAFGSLQPGNDEEDARQLMLDVVGDAADLEALDANLPLIQGLYSDSLNAIKNYKGRKEDKFIQNYVQARDNQGNIPKELSGSNQLKLLKQEQSRELDVNVKDEEGKSFANTVDADGNVIRSILTVPTTNQQRQTADINTTRAKLRPRGVTPLAMIGSNGQPLFLDKDQNTVVTPVMVDGKQEMVSYAGDFETSLGLRLTKQQSALLKQQLDINISTSKSLKANMHQLAKEITGAVGISNVNMEGKIDAPTALLEQQYQEVINKINEKLADKPTLRDEVIQKYNSLININKQLSDINYDIGNTKFSVDFNKMLDNSKLTTDEYNSYYPRVADTIMLDTPTAEQIRSAIIDKWEEAKKGPAALSEEDPLGDVLKIWNQLNVVDKGEIMAWVKRLEE